MFICRPCKEGMGVFGLMRSWGNCEICCRAGTYCFDIPASRMPKARDEIAVRVIEELFGLARERRLIAATHEADELACHEEHLAAVIAAVPADVLPEIVRNLVVALDQASHAAGLITKGG